MISTEIQEVNPSKIYSTTRPRISILIPAYNVERFIEKTIRSCMDQSFSDIEIIVVDDGSTDKTPEIISSLAKEDNRIILISKTNGGYGTAMNAALDAASGDYIAIVEGDDYITEDFCFILYNEAINLDLEVCTFNSYLEVRDCFKPRFVYTYFPGKHQVMNLNQIIGVASSGVVNSCFGIYRRSFLLKHNIRWNTEYKTYGDVLFKAKVYFSVGKMKIIESWGYYYSKKSTLQDTIKPESRQYIIPVFSELFKLIRDGNYEKERRDALLSYAVSLLYWHYLKSMEYPGYSAISDAITDLVKSNVPENLSIIGSKACFDFLKCLGIKANIRILKDRGVAPKLTQVERHSSVIQNSYTEHLSLGYLHIGLYRNNITSEKTLFMAQELQNFMLNGFIDSSIRKKEIEDTVRLVLSHLVPNDFMTSSTHSFINLFQYLHDRGDKTALPALKNLIVYTPKLLEHLQQFPKTVGAIGDLGFSHTSFKRVEFIESASKGFKETFLEFISNKKIAIVGNSPCELKKKKGSLIDSYDIVVRFNNFSSDVSVTDDYGKKTDIWVVTPALDLLHYRSDISTFKYTIVAQPHARVAEKRFNYIYNHVISGNKLFFMDCLRPRKETNINVISVGLYTIRFFLDYLDHIQGIHLFGFSMLDGQNDKRHYFENDPVKSKDITVHKWEEEFQIYQQYLEILREKGKLLG